MLRKIKAYVAKRALSGEMCNVDSPQPSASIQDDDKFDKFKIDDIKMEPLDGNFDSENFNASQYVSDSDNTRDFPDVPMMKEDTDLADIKVEDIEDIKVDGIKVEDLDVNIKVESIDDINVDDMKVEDIKLENEDFDLCKQSDEEQSNLVDGLLEADIEFLSQNLGNIESEVDARKTIEKLTGANPDTLTLDEFDLGTALSTSNVSSIITYGLINRRRLRLLPSHC